MNALAQKISVPLIGTKVKHRAKQILFISNAADKRELDYVFNGSQKEFVFWQNIHLNGECIGNLGVIRCTSDEFSQKCVHKVRKKTIQLVDKAIKKEFSVFLLGASTKFMQKKLERLFPECAFLNGNELTALAISSQEKKLLDPSKNVLITGGSSHLATLNAELLQEFMPIHNIRPNARGDEIHLKKKFARTPFTPVSLSDIQNGFRTSQLINSTHFPVLEKKDFKRLGIKLCLEPARPTVYEKICQELNIQWLQLGIFSHPKLSWDIKPLDIEQNEIFACFLEGYLFAKYGDLPIERLLALARQEGFKLQHVD